MIDQPAKTALRPTQRKPDRYVAGMTIAIAVAGLGLSAAFTYQATGDSTPAVGAGSGPSISSGSAGARNDDGEPTTATGRAPIAVSGGS